ncbi:hypothetical protein AYO40_02065 [Planctomycetaceae bacterium SCGC AG-212-D15]|nr:hypothetical protein AYO40_02065 [Planctomycetaceae bacterium SCGC AG-212-D15]
MPCRERLPLGSLAWGLWAVSSAWLLAIAATYLAGALGIHRAPSSDILPSFQSYFTDTSSQMLMFGIVMSIGPVLAYVSTHFREVNRPVSPRLVLPLLVAAVLIFLTIRSIRRGVADLALAGLLVACLVGAGLFRMTGRPTMIRRDFEAAPTDLRVPTSVPWFARSCTYLFEVVLLLGIGLVLFPYAPTDLGVAYASNLHPVFYCVGPALACFGKGLLPGKDYLAQYGIGPGYLATFLLRENLCRTLAALVEVEAMICWGFFFSAYLVLRQWFGSRAWAGLVCALVVIATFHTDFLAYPSSIPVRFPLLFLVVWSGARTLAEGSGERGSSWHLFFTGTLLGLSVFWSTECGLLFCVALFIGFVAVRWRRTAFLRDGICLGLWTCATLALFSVVAFGRNVLSFDFGWAQLGPALTYGSGFWGVLIDWNSWWNLPYAIVIPSLNAASAGVALSLASQSTEKTTRRDLAALGLMALIANGFLMKWANRGHEVVWVVNAVPSWIVLAWWLRKCSTRLAEYGVLNRSRFLRLASPSMTIASLVAAVGYLIAVGPDRDLQCLRLGVEAVESYPSVAKGWLGYYCPTEASRENPVKMPIQEADVELIRRWTGPTDQVAIVSSRDCDYYIRARRAPKAFVVPCAYIFLRPQLDRTLERLDLLFVEMDVSGQLLIPPTTFGTTIHDLLQNEFERVDAGSHLACFSRKARMAQGLPIP